MTWKDHIFRISLVALLLLSLALKAIPIGREEAVSVSLQSEIGRQLDVRMTAQDFVRTGVINLTQDGGYQLRLYRTLDCPDARIGLTTMFRNAEAENLIASKFNRELSKAAYLYGNQLYATFPDFRFWVGRYREKILKLIGRTPRPEYLVVIAIGAFGNCRSFDQLFAGIS